jgi:hypothetical protein
MASEDGVDSRPGGGWYVIRFAARGVSGPEVRVSGEVMANTSDPGIKRLLRLSGASVGQVRGLGVRRDGRRSVLFTRGDPEPCRPAGRTAVRGWGDGVGVMAAAREQPGDEGV